MKLRLFGVIAGLSLLLLLTIVLAVLAGGGGGLGPPDFMRVDLSPGAIVDVVLWKLSHGMWGITPGEAQLAIVWDVRLPRTLLAAAVGAALSVAGSIFQTTLRNPLADPLLLGVAAGAALAASIVILLGLTGAVGPALAASFGAAGTLAFVFLVAGRRGRFDPARMVLAGVIASTFYSALTLLLLSLSPSRNVEEMLAWTMGDFADYAFGKARWAVPVCFLLCLLSNLGARPLNLLALGDDTARSAGLAVGPVRALLYGLGAALTGVSVAAAGIVGFVGLVVPHVSRRLFGADQRVALPAAALLGAILCALADVVARLAVPVTQLLWAKAHGRPAFLTTLDLPVGVITALFGAPFFLLLLLRSRKGEPG